MPTEANWNVGASAAAAYLLDSIATAATSAYSTRKVRSAYAGSCIRVRRSSDNAEADIGFAGSGILDTVALLAHTGTGGTDTGFVVKWYDQGGSLDAVQVTAVSQPKIVVAGVTNTLNSNPAIKFEESGLTHFVVTATTSQVVSASAFTCMDTFSATTISSASNTFPANMHWADDGSANFEPFGCGGNPTYNAIVQVASSGNKNPTKSISLATTYIGTSRLGAGGGLLEAYVNGGTAGTVACGNIDSVTVTPQILGANYNRSASLDGHMLEFILYNVALSNVSVNTLATTGNVVAGGTMASYAGVSWVSI